MIDSTKKFIFNMRIHKRYIILTCVACFSLNLAYAQQAPVPAREAEARERARPGVTKEKEAPRQRRELEPPPQRAAVNERQRQSERSGAGFDSASPMFQDRMPQPPIIDVTLPPPPPPPTIVK